jgi:hypothetical protein
MSPNATVRPSYGPEALGTNLGTKLGDTAEIGRNEWTVHNTAETPDLDRQDVEDPMKPSPVGS